MEAAFLSKLQVLLVEPLSQVVDASSPDLDILATSEAWTAMFAGPESRPTMRQQLGRDVFFQLIEWLEDFLESGAGVGGNARKGAKFRKLCGKDANGSWFKASLMVTVPERVEGLPNGMDPVVLSLVRKKLMRRTPPNQTQAAPGCDTILEEIDPDDETASDATSTTQSSAMTSSFSSDFWKDGTAADPEGALPGAVDWTSHTSIQEFEFLRIIPVDGMPGGSTGAPGTQEPPRPRRKILISL